MTPTKLAGYLSAAVLGTWAVLTVVGLADGTSLEDFHNFSMMMISACVFLICWPDRDGQD